MKITHEMLKTFGACEKRSTAFRAAWPDGCSIEEGAAWATRDDLLWLAGYTLVPSVAEAAYRALMARPDVTHDDLRWLSEYASVQSVAEAAKKELEK